MLKNLFGTKKNITGNSQLEGLSILQSINKSQHQRADSVDAAYLKAFSRGLSCLKVFSETLDNKDLEEAMNYMLEANKINSNRAEPYYYLAHISYLVENMDLAKKYFKMASFLKPDLEGLVRLGQKIDIGG